MVAMRERGAKRPGSLGAIFACVLIVIVAGVSGISAQETADAPSGYHQFDSLWSGSNAPFLDLSSSTGLLGGLSVSGYAQTTSGMWVNSAGLTRFGRSSG